MQMKVKFVLKNDYNRWFACLNYVLEEIKDTGINWEHWKGYRQAAKKEHCGMVPLKAASEPVHEHGLIHQRELSIFRFLPFISI